MGAWATFGIRPAIGVIWDVMAMVSTYSVDSVAVVIF